MRPPTAVSTLPTSMVRPLGGWHLQQVPANVRHQLQLSAECGDVGGKRLNGRDLAPSPHWADAPATAMSVTTDCHVPRCREPVPPGAQRRGRGGGYGRGPAGEAYKRGGRAEHPTPHTARRVSTK